MKKTQYELTILRNNKYADRIEWLVQSPHILMWTVDHEFIYTHFFDDNGKCTSANWDTL